MAVEACLLSVLAAACWSFGRHLLDSFDVGFDIAYPAPPILRLLRCAAVLLPLAVVPAAWPLSWRRDALLLAVLYAVAWAAWGVALLLSRAWDSGFISPVWPPWSPY